MPRSPDGLNLLSVAQKLFDERNFVYAYLKVYSLKINDLNQSSQAAINSC